MIKQLHFFAPLRLCAFARKTILISRQVAKSPSLIIQIKKTLAHFNH